MGMQKPIKILKYNLTTEQVIYYCSSMQTAVHTSEDQLLVALRDIGKGIAVARDRMAFVVDPSVLGDAAIELVGLSTELDSLRVQLIAQSQTNGVPQTSGQRTMGQFIAAHTNHAAMGTNIDAAMAKWLRDYPLFAGALERRDMTMAHLRHLKTKVSNGRTFVELRQDQEFFVGAARDCSFDGFTAACAYWVIHIDPDGAEPKDQIASTFLKLRKGHGGRVTGEFEFDAAIGDALKTMIDHETQKLRINDRETGAVRSTLQRQAAAFVALAERGFRREDGTHPVPLLNIVMSEKVAEWAIDQLNNPSPERVPVDPFDIDGRCELIDGTPIHPLLVMAATQMFTLSKADLRRYVTNAKSRIIDYSYNVRSAPEHLRTANHIEHRGRCALKGCDAPHAWLQIDHIDPDSNGGETSLKNTQPFCGGDNHAKGAQTGCAPGQLRPNPPKQHRPRPNRISGDDEDDAAAGDLF